MTDFEARPRRGPESPYDVVRLKGRVDDQTLRNLLNQRWNAGWALHGIYEIDHDAVVIFIPR